MPLTKKIIPAAAFLIAMIAGTLYCDSPKMIAVIGFMDKNAKANNSINLVITKSFITFLGKLQGVNVVPYSFIQKSGDVQNFLSARTEDDETALNIGLSFHAGELITGDYTENKKNSTITINVKVFDVTTGEMLLKRSYTGGSDADLFVTVDKAIRNLSSLILGHAVTVAKLNFNISDTPDKYNLYINGVNQKVISMNVGFSDEIIADENTHITLESVKLGAIVFETNVSPRENENLDLKYTPSGTLRIDAPGYPNADVMVDDNSAGRLDTNGTLNIKMKPGMTHTIALEKYGKVLGSKTVIIEKSGDASVSFGTVPVVETGVNSSTGTTVTPKTGAGETGGVNKPEFRRIYFPVRILEGGLGGTIGLEYLPLEPLRLSVMAGGVYLRGSLVADAGALVSLNIIKAGAFSSFVSAGGFCYFSDPFNISPMAALEIDYGMFFLEGGARYSIQASQLFPMLCIGIRF